MFQGYNHLHISTFRLLVFLNKCANLSAVSNVEILPNISEAGMLEEGVTVPVYIC